MAGSDPTYDQLKQRSEDYEAIVEALRDGQIDAVVGKGGIALLRLAETERQLRHSQARLHVALEASGGGVYERAVPPCADDYHSDRWAEMLGYRPDALPPSDRLLDWLFEQVHPDDRPGAEQAYREFVEGQADRYDAELRLRHSEGHWVWVHDVARAIDRGAQRRVQRLAGMTFDITRRKQAERVLRENEARYRLLFEHNPDGVFAVDPAGRFLQVNPACEQISGYSAAELMRMSYMEICAPDQLRNTRTYFEHALAEPVHSYLETALIRKDGRRMEIWVAGEPIVVEGRVVSIHCTARDITERKAAENALSELNATLEQQVAARTALAEQRAHGLRRLAAELSHTEHRERKRMAKLLHDDLQQLLIAVRLRLPALAEVGPADLEQQIEKVDALVGECIATSRNLTQELSPLVLQTGTVPDTIYWLSEWFRVKHGLTVTVQTREEFPPIAEHLRIFIFGALRELLFNVVKHSGKLEARVEATARKGWLTVQVDDCGEAFDPKAVEARFDRPESFGLFNIRERLEALGGKLVLRASPGGGASFRFMVPLAEDAPSLPDGQPRVPAVASPGARREGQGGPIRLLLVEDHAVVREGLVGLLNAQPEFEVIGEAADGVQAVQLANDLHPDAIIMDVDLPAMDGREATRRIRQAHCDVVIIGLSFYDDDAVGRSMLEAGADTYVSKHAAAKDFVAAVRAACLPRRPRERTA